MLSEILKDYFFCISMYEKCLITESDVKLKFYRPRILYVFPFESIYRTHLLISITLQVKASILTIEADQVQKGIVDLVNRHGIRKLVIGAMPEK